MSSLRSLNLASAAIGLAYGHLPCLQTRLRHPGGNRPFEHGHTIQRSTKHPGNTGKRRRRRNRHRKAETIDTGDAVFHRPTGEVWLVARVDGDRVYWCGYPFGGSGSLSDCKLRRKATPSYRHNLLVDIANSSGSEGSHIRSWAMQRLESERPEVSP